VQGERAIHKTRAAGEMPDPMSDGSRIFPAELSKGILLTWGEEMWQDVATPRPGVIPAQEEPTDGRAVLVLEPVRTHAGRAEQHDGLSGVRAEF